MTNELQENDKVVDETLHFSHESYNLDVLPQFSSSQAQENNVDPSMIEIERRHSSPDLSLFVCPEQQQQSNQSDQFLCSSSSLEVPEIRHFILPNFPPLTSHTKNIPFAPVSTPSTACSTQVETGLNQSRTQTPTQPNFLTPYSPTVEVNSCENAWTSFRSSTDGTGIFLAGASNASAVSSDESSTLLTDSLIVSHGKDDCSDDFPNTNVSVAARPLKKENLNATNIEIKPGSTSISVAATNSTFGKYSLVDSLVHSGNIQVSTIPLHSFQLTHSTNQTIPLDNSYVDLSSTNPIPVPRASFTQNRNVLDSPYVAKFPTETIYENPVSTDSTDQRISCNSTRSPFHCIHPEIDLSRNDTIDRTNNSNCSTIRSTSTYCVQSNANRNEGTHHYRSSTNSNKSNLNSCHVDDNGTRNKNNYISHPQEQLPCTESSFTKHTDHSSINETIKLTKRSFKGDTSSFHSVDPPYIQTSASRDTLDSNNEETSDQLFGLPLVSSSGNLAATFNLNDTFVRSKIDLIDASTSVKSCSLKSVRSTESAKATAINEPIHLSTSLLALSNINFVKESVVCIDENPSFEGQGTSYSPRETTNTTIPNFSLLPIERTDLDDSVEDSLSRSSMGGYSEDPKTVCVGSTVDDRSRGDDCEGWLIGKPIDQVDSKTMEELPHRRVSAGKLSFTTDYNAVYDEGDNNSTASTIDSNLLNSSGFPSPSFTSLSGRHYLPQEEVFNSRQTEHSEITRESGSVANVDVSRGIEVPIVTSVRQTSAQRNGSFDGEQHINTVVEMTMLPSAGCSVSTAPSTADEASSIGMDSAAGFDYFRFRSHDSIQSSAPINHTALSTTAVDNQVTRHHRNPSWDASPHQQTSYNLISNNLQNSFVTNMSVASPKSNNTNMNVLTIEQPSFSGLPSQQLQNHPQQQLYPSSPSAWTLLPHSARIQHAQSHFPQQQRVASFRGGEQQHQNLYHPPSPGGRLQNPQQLQWPHHRTISPPPSHRYASSDLSSPLVVGSRAGDNRHPYQHRSNNNVTNNSNSSYHSHHPPHQGPQRKSGMYNQPLLPPSSNTPSRNTNRDAAVPVLGGGPPRSSNTIGRGISVIQKTSPSSSVSSPHRGSQGSSQSGIVLSQSSSPNSTTRSSSEVLKTLLRKKACLYEPDTSRAVALVTWLVGRELALEFGYFSRQQLQAGVHACVTSKIDAGVITRTKVNRCMQIILNSCFHYIIPRPDGTEENGDSFRRQFAEEVRERTNSIDATELLATLPPPWRDMHVNRDDVLHASSNADDVSTSHNRKETSDADTPAHSPRLDGMVVEGLSPKEIHQADGGELGADGKRAVLLCFNENVRCAEDVFRCHNEFIRDTAHASNLQLSSNEWLMFFGSDAASNRYLWGGVGIPVPTAEGYGQSKPDALGMFNVDELSTFRTSWCSKRYDHNHELCGFAHAEVNCGWLRRNPKSFKYRDELCPCICLIDNKWGSTASNKTALFINECPHGVNCQFAHSFEEILYHPSRYKQCKTCTFSGRAGGCPFGDICPNFHPLDSYRFPKKTDSRSPRHSRQHHFQQQHGNKVQSGTPTLCSPLSSPIIYGSPAPLSSFEQQLQMPGLQSLFRRQCAVIRNHIRTGNTCGYSCFGDDAGIEPNNKNMNSSQTTSTLPVSFIQKPRQF